MPATTARVLESRVSVKDGYHMRKLSILQIQIIESGRDRVHYQVSMTALTIQMTKRK